MITVRHDSSHWAASVPPNATVFVSSACIMVVELVAGRLISRYIGQSLYTWTGIISVVLAGICAGNYIGGRLAERNHGRGMLAMQFLFAAAGCLATLALNRMAGEWGLLLNLSWPARILAHVSLTFLGPALLLGTISPVIAKRALVTGRAEGRTIGGVYAWATAGSIVGTFLTGYGLIMWIRATSIVFIAAAGLASVGVIYAFGALFPGSTRRNAAPASVAPVAPQAPWRPGEWLPLLATVFMANACVMAMEMVAGRMVAAQFGQSLYGWTSVIGIVLAGITFGSALGGWLADAFQPRRTLAVLLVLSAAGCIVATKVGGGLVRSTFLVSYVWPTQIALYGMAVFFLPSLTLGATTPVIAKAALALGRRAGTTIGNVYAWSAFGSIVGTWAAGFYLIALFGMTHTLCLIAAALMVLACAHGYRSLHVWVGAAACGVALLGAFPPFPAADAIGGALELRPETLPNVIYRDESQYSCIRVHQNPNDPNLREMSIDHMVHSKIDLGNPCRLKYEYEWIYEAVLDKSYPPPQSVTAMVIGGGGYTLPRYLEVVRPGSYVEVAEIDAAVTEAAYAAFGLPRDTGVRIYTMDARNRIADLVRAKRRGEPVPVFDCIFGDAFNDYSVPYHLITLELTRDIADLLAPDGLYMLNVIDLFESGRFLGAMVNTCRAVFPHVYTFTAYKHTSERDTFVLVCARRPLELDDLPAALRDKYGYEGELLPSEQLQAVIARAGNTVLTDDFAPVDNMLAPVVRMNANANLLLAANQLLDANKLDQAIKKSRQLLNFGRESNEAYEIIGIAMTWKGNLDEGVANLRKAVELEPSRAVSHHHLGDALLEQAKGGAPTLDEAEAQWRQAIQLEPRLGMAYRSLGAARVQRRDYAPAVDILKKAIELEPNVVANHVNLAVALYNLGDMPGAIAELNTSLDIDPAFPGIHPQLAIAYYKSKEYDKAWDAVAKARQAGESIPARFEADLRRDSGRTP